MLKSILVAACFAGAAYGCATDSRFGGDAAELESAKIAQAPNASCLRSTGTRIVLKQGQCAVSAGRVYTNDDLERTGALTPAEALRLLDPAF